MRRHANASHVYLQTSAPEAVALFEQWAAQTSVPLVYTQNERAQGHDLWADRSARARGSNHSGERASAVAQAVNALVASRSRRFLSPASSMWTWFVRALMGRRVGDSLGDSGSEQVAACLTSLSGGEEVRNDSAAGASLSHGRHRPALPHRAT